jgi:CheY-like chemotaxis protein
MSRLLVVDDDEISQEIVVDFLAEMGHELLLANDGLEAWQRLESGAADVDLLILDRLMPRMDGVELLCRLKADQRFRHLPVIMQTSACNPDEVAEGLAAGAWYYLAKPYNAQALVSIVAAALEDRRGLRQLDQLDEEINTTLGLVQEARYCFRSLDEAKILAAVLARYAPGNSMVLLGLTELMINAVEHGNLAITYDEKSRLLKEDGWEQEVQRRLTVPEFADRWAEVAFRRQGSSLCFTITDQGSGFDWQPYLSLDPQRAFDSHGRGIAMTRQLAFSSIEYLGCGNQVRVALYADAELELL